MQLHRVFCFAGGAGLALLATVTSAHSPGAETQARETQPGARVAVDPETGKLRPVEHDDGAAAGSAAALRGSARSQGAPRAIYSRSGIRGMALDESFMSFTVVRRNADGSLDSACADSEDGALKALHEKSVGRSARAGGRHETE